ncbi:MAG TPA: anaerobic ribonucleoside-triphosphate reductase activating protein [Syntrophomonadaceae bacterium]|nr:anaerobic ribonucleoside-triphosphate reductase activating protein [Syntrophomonadaceae bacterium]
MKFAGMINQSLLDYPGEIATVLFTRGCNFACPFCHNGHLLLKFSKTQSEEIELEKIMEFLKERKGFIDAVVISGGEPTLNQELPEVIRKIKSMGFLVKLDTNGTNIDMLSLLLKEKLLDYVAMDIKAPLEFKKYQQASGKLTNGEFFNVRAAVNLLLQADIKVEFRTTVIPELHTYGDIEAIARHIAGARLYSLQQFNPGNTLDPAFQSCLPYSREALEHMARICSPYIDEVRVVNI